MVRPKCGSHSILGLAGPISSTPEPGLFLLDFSSTSDRKENPVLQWDVGGDLEEYPPSGKFYKEHWVQSPKVSILTPGPALDTREVS